jgi:hypothetical protein
MQFEDVCVALSLVFEVVYIEKYIKLSADSFE